MEGRVESCPNVLQARNLGQLVGGAINLSKNHLKGAEAGVTPDTYIAFLIIECLA
jgi:hypothetical protein